MAFASRIDRHPPQGRLLHRAEGGFQVKAHEVPYGTCSLVELVPSDAVSFDSSVALRREIAILFSESTGQSLLRAGPTAVSVIGRDKQAQAILARLRDRNLPRLGWVTATTPKSGPIEWIQVQVHEFPVQYSWPGDIDVGVDEKVVDVIRHLLCAGWRRRYLICVPFVLMIPLSIIGARFACMGRAMQSTFRRRQKTSCF